MQDAKEKQQSEEVGRKIQCHHPWSLLWTMQSVSQLDGITSGLCSLCRNNDNSSHEHMPANVWFPRYRSTWAPGGTVNFDNQHAWTGENAHATVSSRHQQLFSLSIMAGAVCHTLFGSHVLPNSLTLRHASTSWKTTCLISWTTFQSSLVVNCISCMLVPPHTCLVTRM